MPGFSQIEFSALHTVDPIRLYVYMLAGRATRKPVLTSRHLTCPICTLISARFGILFTT
jgi:hypothetical protein